MVICSNCKGNQVYQDYPEETVFRCFDCGRVGLNSDFEVN